ncbi:hypothetical protein HvAV-3i_gp036 [Heliothis virescens ascovirus 3i]|nr:hypothetical protein HvAV-3i_gp036 [Heliothis virescens ascovirus 3i]
MWTRTSRGGTITVQRARKFLLRDVELCDVTHWCACVKRRSETIDRLGASYALVVVRCEILSQHGS